MRDARNVLSALGIAPGAAPESDGATTFSLTPVVMPSGSTTATLPTVGAGVFPAVAPEPGGAARLTSRTLAITGTASAAPSGSPLSPRTDA